MKFNIWFHFEEEIPQNDGDETVQTKTTRKNLRSVNKEELKDKINEMIELIPNDATNVFLEVSKTYDEDQIAAEVAKY